MIVMLALLNDGAILSIAYDNVIYRMKPEAWNMRTVLGVSTVLGVAGVVAVFALFYLADRVFLLDRAVIQTMIYLKLSVAGHLTIFLTRTRGPFWSIRPARILLLAVLGTQTVATLIAVYGLFMAPLGWGWALFVWGWAVAWALLNDRLKLLTYWILDSTAAKSAPKAKSDPAPEAKPRRILKRKSPSPDRWRPSRKPRSTTPSRMQRKPQPRSQTSNPRLNPARRRTAQRRRAPIPKRQRRRRSSGGGEALSGRTGRRTRTATRGQGGQRKPIGPKAGASKPDTAKAAELKPDVKTQPEAETNAGFTKLMHTTLGDVLLAGLANHPDSVEKIVAEAVTKAEAAPKPRSHKRTNQSRAGACREIRALAGSHTPSLAQPPSLDQRAVPSDAIGARMR